MNDHNLLSSVRVDSASIIILGESQGHIHRDGLGMVIFLLLFSVAFPKRLVRRTYFTQKV